MSSLIPTFPASGRAPMAVPAAAFEVLGYLCVVAVGTLCFLLSWLTPEGAGVLTVLLLSVLIVLAWKRFDQGRHPCFLFLCALMFFQGGRLIAYCLGAEPEPLKVIVVTPYPFSLPRDEQGIVLLCLALSAICVYAPCCWKFHSILPPDSRPVRQYLPYLYLVLFVGLPFLLFKNYRFYEYAQQHGGYRFMLADPGALAASVPFLVRSVSAILFPVFLAIYVFETRRKYLYLATVLYFAAILIILVLGSRGALFQLIVTLWYVAHVKSGAKPRILLLCAGVVILALLAGAVQALRENPDDLDSSLLGVTALVDFIDSQGSSLDVTQVAVKYRDRFAPYAGSYLVSELQSSYASNDARSYSRGKLIDSDITVLLSPVAFDLGFGTGGSYIGEAYILGGLASVVIVSLGIGVGLRLLHRMSRRADLLFVSATLLFSAIWLPRGDLLAWLSAFSRNIIVIVFLWIGWLAFRLITSIRRNPSIDHLRERAPAT
jgi:oligosaccharide repeat unit polymerase